MDCPCIWAHYNQETNQSNQSDPFIQCNNVDSTTTYFAHNIEDIKTRLHSKAAEYKLTLCICTPLWCSNRGYYQEADHK